MIYYMFREDPKIILYSVLTMVPGALLHLALKKRLATDGTNGHE